MLENELLTEVTAFPYISQISAATKKSHPTDDIADTWTFSNGSQGLGVKSAHLVKGKLRAFRKSKLPLMFFVFETQGEKVKKNIIKIQKPNQSVVTIAKIIASTMKSSMTRTDVVLRIPSKTTNIDAVASISERFIKREGLQHKYKDKIDVKGNYYMVFSIDKQNSVDWEYLLGVKVDNDTVDDASAEKLEMQVKRMMPKKISLVGVVGTNYNGKAYHKNLDKYLSKNPSPVVNSFIEKETINYSGFNYDHDFPLINNRSIDRLKSRTSTERYAEGAIELIGDFVNRKITFEDVCLMNDRGREAVRLINNYSDGDQDYAGRLLYHIVESAKDVHMYPSGDNAEPLESTIESAPQKIKDSIISYTDGEFSNINKSLMGDSDIYNKTNLELVSTMDDIFRKYGIRLNNDIIAYRGMFINIGIFSKILEQKIFHFRTYVSTTTNIDVAHNFAPQSVSDIPKFKEITELPEDRTNWKPMQNMLFSIRGLNNTLAIIPGKHARYPIEHEIILSRGTTIRIDSAYGDDSEEGKINVMANASIISPSDIQINEAIYDGDYFMLTGELKQLTESELMSFNEFSTLNENKKTKSKKSNDKLIAGELALKLYAKSKMKLSKEERAEQLRLHKKYVLNCG